MTLNVHNPHAPLGAYSNGISTPAGGRWLHIAGQVGMTVADLVKVTHYLVRGEDLPAYNPVRLRHLGSARPASTLVVVAGLARPEWRIEVEAVAWRA